MPKPRPTAPAPTGRLPKLEAAPRRRITSPMARWSLAAWLVAASTGCNRHIEEDPPIPEHRYETCETWCSMIFDPTCPLEAEVPTEEECFEGCLVQDIVWAPIGDGQDACAATYIPFVDCMASLSCSERRQHFALRNVVPDEERSSCGVLLRPQLDCQTAHY